MYSLLIVDDEIHVVKGLQADLRLDKLEISHVYTAYNMRQAKEVYEAHTVDIMLCDIEMPQGSGLELLEWVNANSPKTETIFLTSHADFKYAKQAIQLGSLDYLLKPVPDEELEKVILKAKDKLGKVNASNRIMQLWSHHHPVFIERFWLDILQQTIPARADAIAAALDERNLPMSDTMQLLPVLISVHRWRKEMSVRDRKIMEYALRNSAEEMIAGTTIKGSVLTIKEDMLLIILPYEQEEAEREDTLQSRCEAYIHSCMDFFYCDLSCYIGNLTLIQDMAQAYLQLRGFERNNVAYENQVFTLTGAVAHAGPSAALPDMASWPLLLRKGMAGSIEQEAAEYLHGRIAAGELDAQLLQQFQQSFLQTVYFVLHSEGKQAHQLFCDSTSMELSRCAAHSVKDMLIWLRHLLAKLNNRSEACRASHQVVDTVKQYISSHLDQPDLSREEIAAHAFLNPDYLARLFKKDTGMSIMEYLFQERMKLAAQLLGETEQPVGSIAMSIGYSHFSHFSKMFKKHTGINPNEYRQLKRDSV